MFNQQVWQLCKQIPAGKVSTYKELAHALNCKAYRAVGNALNKNPFSPEVPCHRIVKSDGFLGGFAQGKKKKQELLQQEGIIVENRKIHDFHNKLYKF